MMELNSFLEYYNRSELLKSLTLIISVLVIYLIVNKIHSRRNQFIRDDFSVSFAKIIKVHGADAEFDLSVEYEYQVNENSFTRILEVEPKDKSKFRKCLYRRFSCESYLLLIIYSTKRPELSLVRTDKFFSNADTTIVLEKELIDEFY